MASVTKRKWSNPDGSDRIGWIVNYVDPGGARRRKQFKTRKSANAYLTKVHAEIAGGTHVGGTSVTLARAAELWLEACKRGRNGRVGVEAHTLRAYENHVNNHIVPYFGGVRLNELNAPAVSEFRNHLIDGTSRPTARKVLTSLSGILSEARTAGLVGQNVSEGITVYMGGRHKPEVDIPSRVEIRLILQTVDDLATQANQQYAKAWRRYRAFIQTAILTGMRASELRGLPWGNVDLKTGLVKVRQRANEIGVLGPPKSKAGNRDINIPTKLIAVLSEWRDECPVGEHDLVFPNGKGRVESLSNYYRRGWIPLQERAEVVDDKGKALYKFHALRHFRASVLIAKRASITELMSELGHASVSVSLNTYSHLLVDDDHERKQRAEAIADDLFSSPQIRLMTA